MLAKLFYLAAVVLFLIVAIGSVTAHNLVDWGLASVAAGLLVEGLVVGSRRVP